jgi:hypothetical protein
MAVVVKIVGNLAYANERLTGGNDPVWNCMDPPPSAHVTVNLATPFAEGGPVVRACEVAAVPEVVIAVTTMPFTGLPNMSDTVSVAV